MKKEIKNNRYYLLGKRKEDDYIIYLEKPSWDCDWYWGFGYIKAYKTKNHYDYEEHTNFDSLFLKKNIYDSFIEYFSETTLSNKEIWILLGYMKEFYILQEYAELLQYGNYITSKAINILDKKNKAKNLEEYKRINTILLPELFDKIDKLLTIEEVEE